MQRTNLKIWWAISVFLLVVAVCTSSVFATGTYDGGDGLTAATAFQINTPAQMDEIGQHSEDWGSYFILTADIDLSGYTGTAFHIIGNYTNRFIGSFDGSGHTISNFTYTSTGTNGIGLFGYVNPGGEIKYLGMVDVNVDAGTGQYAGGLVGHNRGTVSNCYATGSVSGDNYKVGGLVGGNYHGTVSNCYAAGSVWGNWYVGGLVGANEGGIVSNCYDTGSVSGSWCVGGLVGGNSGTVSNCYATGSVAGNGYVGGLVGYNSSTYNTGIFASFWDMQTTGQPNGVGLNEGSGTVEVYGRTTAEMQTESTFTDYDWDFTTPIWTIDEGNDYPRLWWENRVPVANADGPYSINVGDSLTLDASGSTDPDDDIVSYDWDLDDDGTFETDAGGQAIFDVDYAYLASLGFIAGGPYDIHVQVTDSEQQSDTDSSTLTIAPPPVIEAVVDIKPGSCPNPLNVKSKGVVPVAILGSAAFDVTTIDAGSIFLNGARNVRSGYEDVAGFIADANDCECTTLGPDGFTDLTLKFMTQNIVATFGEVNHGDVLELPLAGFLFDETPIEGADCVVIRGKHKPINKADINKDGVVNMLDVAMVADNWLESSVVED